MSLKHINSKLQSERGFTIVELLIVIVVIGILAAITIISFNGFTARANATAAEVAASSVLKKAEAYNADTGLGYPTDPDTLTTAATTTTYSLTGITFTEAETEPTVAPANSEEVKFFSCASATGVQVEYWDYASTATDKWTAVTTGSCTTPTYVEATP